MTSIGVGPDTFNENPRAVEGDTHPLSYPGEFCRVVIGSTIHGLSVAGTDDLDLMGVCMEGPEGILGMGKPFEQHIWRSQPEGHPSGAGDVDLTVYSLRKFMRLAAKGNPTLLNLFFVPEEYRHVNTLMADHMRSLVPIIVSKEAANRYMGYMKQQRERLLGERGQKRTGNNRQKYISESGYDTKYAMHLCRLGMQGIELLETGKITLPVRGNKRDLLMQIRRGEVSLESVKDLSLDLEAQLLKLRDSSTLPDTADWNTLNNWVISQYLTYWMGRPV